MQYYNVGDSINPEVYGTLGQHFGRFTLKADSKTEMLELVKSIQQKLEIRNTDGADMYVMKFNLTRIE